MKNKLLFTIGLAAFTSGLCAFYLQPADLHTSDLYSFWGAAKLGGKDLYDPVKLQAVQQLSNPLVTEKRFIRPPFYALALRPLGLLDFRNAYYVWYAINILALIGFVYAWRDFPDRYLLPALFLPIAWSFGLGQDVPIMLLLFWTGVRLVELPRPILGGLVLSLCAAKPHLFVFLPLVLMAQKRLRALSGIAVGGVALYVVSASALGIGWPRVFFSAAQANESVFKPRSLSIAGFLSSFGVPNVVWLAFVGAVACAIWYWALRVGWRSGAAMAVACGVISAPHALLYDAALILPLLLLSPLSSAGIVVFGFLCAFAATRFVWVAQVSCLVLVWLARPKPGLKKAAAC